MRTAVLGTEHEPARIAFSVGRPVGNAVERNRVRRRLRAVVREHAELLEPGHGYLIRASSGAARASFGELSTALRAMLGDNEGKFR